MSRVILSTLLLLAAASAAGQQVTLERDSPLYSEPRLESAQVAHLRQGASGEVLGKEGGWLNLKTAAGTGWLFSFNVRFPSQKVEGASSEGVLGARRRSAVTSTIGIRGLDEEDLRQATFDARQMKLLDSYATTREAAEQGSRAAGLAPAAVNYLDSRQ